MKIPQILLNIYQVTTKGSVYFVFIFLFRILNVFFFSERSFFAFKKFDTVKNTQFFNFTFQISKYISLLIKKIKQSEMIKCRKTQNFVISVLVNFVLMRTVLNNAHYAYALTFSFSKISDDLYVLLFTPFFLFLISNFCMFVSIYLFGFICRWSLLNYVIVY